MLSKKEKFFYSTTDLACNIAFGSISFYLLYFMVVVGGLNAGLAGLVFIIGKFWDAISDYLMGRITDKTKCKFGKRRIYMLCGAVPFMLTFMLLWLSPAGANTQALKFLYYASMYIIFSTAWTVVYVPYNTLAANMTDNYDERTQLTSWRMICASFGTILGAAVFSTLAEGTSSVFYELTQSQEKAYLLSSLCFGGFAAILIIVSTLNVKERISLGQDNSYNFIDTIKSFFKMKEFRGSIGLYLFGVLGFDIIMATFMFYVADSLGFASMSIGGLDGSLLSTILIAVPLICGMFGAPIWTYISEKKSKTFAYNLSAILVAALLFPLIFFPQQNIALFATFCALIGLCMSALQIMPWAILPDVADIDEANSGERREGAFYGVVSFVYKVANGIAIFVVGAILSACGYVEGAGSYVEVPEGFVQPDEALLAIRIVIGVLPGLIFLLGIFFSNKSNFSREYMQDIHNKLDALHASKMASVASGAVALTGDIIMNTPAEDVSGSEPSIKDDNDATVDDKKGADNA